MLGRHVAGAVEIKNIVAQLIDDRDGQHPARRDQGGGEIKTAALFGVHPQWLLRCRIWSARPVS